MTEQAVRIVCELQTVGDSLTGRAQRHDGEAREFTGWLGLLGALQALLASTDADRAADGAPMHGSEPNTDLPNRTRGPI